MISRNYLPQEMVIAYSYVDIEFQQLMKMLKETKEKKTDQNAFEQQVDREKEMKDILNVFNQINWTEIEFNENYPYPAVA